jgi:hypothetical protein
VEFEDGASGVLDLSGDLYGAVFEPLRDVRFFEQVSTDEYGVICWPNGADLAPESVYADITAVTAQS